MGKKKQQAALGRSIIKDRFGKKNKTSGDTFLHTSELQDGYDWGRLNLQSVTEQNNLEDFLATAELAGTEFTAEKLNVKFISQDTGGLPRADEIRAIHGLHKQHEDLLRIPRRPAWTVDMAASELDQNEKIAFLDWRRSLAMLQEDERIVLTPYEKNLDFWRQLWRVIERSDLVVQIVDARNPLLFYCADLETYVTEIDKDKVCMVLINKADFLTHDQRETWADYFTERGIRIAFWSAVAEADRQEAADRLAADDNSINDGDTDDEQMDASDDDDDKSMHASVTSDTDELKTDMTHTDQVNNENNYTVTCDKEPTTLSKQERESLDKVASVECAASRDRVEATRSDCDTDLCTCDRLSQGDEADVNNTGTCSVCVKMHSMQIKNTSYVYTGPELLQLFKSLHNNTDESLTTVGMVGYPNVGKSSTINAILKMKKVPVSATPGRTKHFQTLFVDPGLMLCDCPGLVFPSFVTTKADLVLGGILPIDQMRDCLQPIALLCERIPRWMLEMTYGINLPLPSEGEDPHRPPTAHELLTVYGGMRGFMTSRGVPDGPRSSRYLLKDYVDGKLLYSHPPPDTDPVEFNNYKSQEPVSKKQCLAGDGSLSTADVPVPSRIDTDFFQKEVSTIHRKSAHDTPDGPSISSIEEKPWKKHHNKKKKEKLRRVYGYLDQ